MILRICEDLRRRLADLSAKAEAGGGAERNAKQHQAGKLTARDTEAFGKVSTSGSPFQSGVMSGGAVTAFGCSNELCASSAGAVSVRIA